MAAKITLMAAIRQRPASWEATSSRVSFRELSANRCERAGPEPRVLESWTPLIDRDSSIWVCMSARVIWARVVTVLRMLATRRVK